jgi:hypothetical protein
MEVLEDAKMIRAPKMMCGHKGGIHPGPGFAYLECDLCGGRWVTKVDDPLLLLHRQKRVVEAVAIPSSDNKALHQVPAGYCLRYAGEWMEASALDEDSS